jgi:hypothetical protein
MDVNKSRNCDQLRIAHRSDRRDATPVLAISRGWLGPQLLTPAVAIMLLLSPSAPEADVRRGFAIVKALAAVALLPATWTLLQNVPVSLGSIDNPVWACVVARGPNRPETSGPKPLHAGITP